jgi:hypothetical protein
MPASEPCPGQVCCGPLGHPLDSRSAGLPNPAAATAPAAPRPSSGDSTVPQAVESPPAVAAAVVRGFDRPSGGGIPTSRRRGRRPGRRTATPHRDPPPPHRDPPPAAPRPPPHRPPGRAPPPPPPTTTPPDPGPPIRRRFRAENAPPIRSHRPPRSPR